MLFKESGLFEVNHLIRSLSMHYDQCLLNRTQLKILLNRHLIFQVKFKLSSQFQFSFCK